ncbi:MAG: hypothetical protein Kow0069_13580 [Promethearchaeota archaeon]
MELKTELLCKGVAPSESYLKQLQSRGETFSWGRSGGAGPTGGRYFAIRNPSYPGRGYSLANVPLIPEPAGYSDLTVDRELERGPPTSGGGTGDWPPGDSTLVALARSGVDLAELALLSTPSMHQEELEPGVPFGKVALVHGVDCLATTLDQQCKYWSEGKKCLFCAIQLSWKSGRALKEKPPHLLARAVERAVEAGRCNHVTLTSGTGPGPDKGVERILAVAKELADLGVKVPLHVQFEPLADPARELRYMEQLKAAGVVSVGIHLEAWNEEVRARVCPGKSAVPRSRYLEAWRNAAGVFGAGQVETYLLLGVGDSPQDLREAVEEICATGTIPFLVTVREGATTGFRPESLAPRWKEVLELHRHAGKVLKERGLSPFSSKAGCVRCGGCSAVPEAYLEA